MSCHMHADAALHKDTVTFGHMNINNAHMTNHITIIFSCISAILLTYPSTHNDFDMMFGLHYIIYCIGGMTQDGPNS